MKFIHLKRDGGRFCWVRWDLAWNWTPQAQWMRPFFVWTTWAIHMCWGRVILVYTIKPFVP